MTQLSDVIAEIETRAKEKKNQSKHGTSLSSMSEDVAAGEVAEELGRVVTQLKGVTSLGKRWLPNTNKRKPIF